MGELEQQAFEVMAQMYPHEVYELKPEEFWRFFQTQCPSVSRAKMELFLSVSDEGKRG